MTEAGHAAWTFESAIHAFGSQLRARVRPAAHGCPAVPAGIGFICLNRLMAIEIRALAGVHAARDGDVVAEVRGVHGRSVLAALALTPGVISVDALVAALWDETPPSDPVSNLRSVISRLRSQLGKDAIVSDSIGYRLGDDIVTDVQRLERAMTVIRERDIDDDAALDLLDDVLDGWPAHALTDVADSSWFVGQRQRLAETRSLARNERWRLLLAVGRPETAVPELTLAANDNPESEAVCVLLMQALRASGRGAEAARAASTFRRHLADATGFDPSAEFLRAEAELFADDDAQDKGPGESDGDAPGTPLDSDRASSSFSWPTDRFIGRLTDIQRTEAAVADHRLVTIVGPGGVGKTRLTLETSRHWTSHQVCWVRLADEARASGVISAVGQALGLTDFGVRPIDTISNRLSLSQTILVIDNAEHLWDSVRSLVDSLLPRLGDSRLVVTSRKPLAVSGEQVIRLHTLPLDTSPSERAHSPAVELLIARVDELDVDFSWDDANETAAHDICAGVDGLPLGIELAAARVATLGPVSVRDQLESGSAMLRVRGSAESRHDSLGALVDWSVQLLDEDVQHAFAMLSVFAGWFDGDAANAVVGGQLDVFDALHDLSSSSLLDTRVTRGAVRYRMLEPVREVASMRLMNHTSEATREARSLHADWVLSRVHHMCATFLGPYDDAHPDRAQRELDDLESDVIAALGHLRDIDRSPDADEIALQLCALLVEHTRLRLSSAITSTTPSTAAGHVAIAVSMLERYGPQELAREIERARDAAGATDAFVQEIALYGEMLITFYRADFVECRRIAKVLIDSPSTSERHRSNAIIQTAFTLRFEGDRETARRWLDDPRISHPVGGFIDYVRSSVVADTDPDEAIRLLERCRRQAAAEHLTFQARLADVELLWQLHVAGRTTDCFRHAQRLIPRLMSGGYELQVWTALRILMHDLADEYPDAAVRLLATVQLTPAITQRPTRAPEAEAELSDRFATMIDDDMALPGIDRSVAALWRLFEPLITIEPAQPTPSPL